MYSIIQPAEFPTLRGLFPNLLFLIHFHRIPLTPLPQPMSPATLCNWQMFPPSLILEAYLMTGSCGRFLSYSVPCAFASISRRDMGVNSRWIITYRFKNWEQALYIPDKYNHPRCGKCATAGMCVDSQTVASV